MGKPAVTIALSAAERRELEALAWRRKTAQEVTQTLKTAQHPTEIIATSESAH